MLVRPANHNVQVHLMCRSVVVHRRPECRVCVVCNHSVQESATRHTMQINIRHACLVNGTRFNSERCHEYTTYISLTLLWCPEQLFPDMESSLVNTPQDLYGREGRGSSVNTTSMGRKLLCLGSQHNTTI